MDNLVQRFAQCTIDEIDQLGDRLKALVLRDDDNDLCTRMSQLSVRDHVDQLIVDVAHRDPEFVQRIRNTVATNIPQEIMSLWRSCQVLSTESPVYNFYPAWGEAF